MLMSFVVLCVLIHFKYQLPMRHLTGPLMKKLKMHKSHAALQKIHYTQTYKTAYALFCILLALITPSALFASNQSLLSKDAGITSDAFARNVPTPLWFVSTEAKPSNVRTEPYIVWLAETHFRVEGKPSVVVHRVMQAREASALSQIGQYQIEFQPEYQRVELHQLRVRRNGEW
jgi:hypothetical protein